MRPNDPKGWYGLEGTSVAEGFVSKRVLLFDTDQRGVMKWLARENIHFEPLNKALHKMKKGFKQGQAWSKKVLTAFEKPKVILLTATEAVMKQRMICRNGGVAPEDLESRLKKVREDLAKQEALVNLAKSKGIDLLEIDTSDLSPEQVFEKARHFLNLKA